MNIPQGFLYDQNSGLYYRETAGVDSNGQAVRVITWIHPVNGQSFVQHYPVVTATTSTTPSKKKKGNGCFIAILLALATSVVLAIILLFGSIAFLFFGIQSLSDTMEEQGTLTESLEWMADVNLDDALVSMANDGSLDALLRIFGAEFTARDLLWAAGYEAPYYEVPQEVRLLQTGLYRCAIEGVLPENSPTLYFSSNSAGTLMRLDGDTLTEVAFTYTYDTEAWLATLHMADGTTALVQVQEDHTLLFLSYGFGDMGDGIFTLQE